ncbi:hypothetical protein M5K25_017325 [Dendrobium thyrsiflorum]|uniref:Uncharacterized protein n=1 Tax=Dendrobium thyrsiflorum TaxID=117978 RepID=A0ABD0UMS4_DENTH
MAFLLLLKAVEGRLIIFCLVTTPRGGGDDKEADRKSLRSSVSYPKPKRTNAKSAVYSRKTAQNRGKTHLDAESFRNQHLGYENLPFPFQNQHLDAEFCQIQHLGGRIPPSSRRYSQDGTRLTKMSRITAAYPRMLGDQSGKPIHPSWNRLSSQMHTNIVGEMIAVLCYQIKTK